MKRCHSPEQIVHCDLKLYYPHHWLSKNSPVPRTNIDRAQSIICDLQGLGKLWSDSRSLLSFTQGYTRKFTMNRYRQWPLLLSLCEIPNCFDLPLLKDPEELLLAYRWERLWVVHKLLPLSKQLLVVATTSRGLFGRNEDFGSLITAMESSLFVGQKDLLKRNSLLSHFQWNGSASSEADDGCDWKMPTSVHKDCLVGLAGENWRLLGWLVAPTIVRLSTTSSVHLSVKPTN